MKKIETMSDHEMLVELLKAKRRNDIIGIVVIILLLVLIGVLIYAVLTYGPMIKAYIAEMDDTVQKVNETVDELYELKLTLQGYMDSIQEHLNGLKEGFENLLPSWLQ